MERAPQLQEACLLGVLFVQMDKATVDNLRELFNEVDVLGAGHLNRERLKELLEATGTQCDDEAVDNLFELMDLERNGLVSFEVRVFSAFPLKHFHLEKRSV